MSFFQKTGKQRLEKTSISDAFDVIILTAETEIGLLKWSQS
jgi:hypothetical protein